MSADIERLQKAASQDPAQLIKLADTLVAAGRAEEAIQACRRGLGARPDDVPLRLALGRALSAAGHLEEAQAALLDAVSRQTRAPQPAKRQRDDATELSARPPSLADDVEIESEATEQWEAPASAPPPRVSSPSRPTVAARIPSAASRRASEPAAAPGIDDGPTRGESRRARRVEPAPEAMNAPMHSPMQAPAPGPIDLERVAERLLGGTGGDGEENFVPEPAPADPVPDEMRRAFEALRARSFVWLWVALVVVSGGIVGGWIYRAKQREKQIASTIEQADSRVHEATYEADHAAREAYATVLRLEPRSRKFAAMVALSAARLAADHGEDQDAAAWAMLRRSEKEAAKHKPEPDERAERELRQARALLALARGETCSPTDDAIDGDIAARCALQRGDVTQARRILSAATGKTDLRGLLVLGSLELGAGDLDAADSAFGKVLAISPSHQRALVGRALVALERGETPLVNTPTVPVGRTTESWFHLAAGLAATGRDDAKASAELDAAYKGIVHDGRLALLYGRARLQQGRIGEAEQAMRIAERLDPNDGDVAVLDAEVALAKGFEDKVASALSVGTPTPRRLAVLGRALCLTGRYREAANALDAALARRPGDATAVTYRAIARAHLGDAAGAVRELDKAAKTLGSTTPRYGLGLLAYEKHDLLKAKTELSGALEHDSESFRARALLGRVLRDLGKPKEALVELERVSRDAPALASVHASLGRLYLDLARDRDARNELRKVLDAGKASAEDKLGYAEAVIHLGLVDESERALADAATAGALAPRLARLKLELGSWKGPKEALVAAKALEKERRGPQANDARLAIAAADAWRRAGDLKHAADDLRSALIRDPLHANLGLGKVELLQNDPAGAELSYRGAAQAWEKTAGGADDLTEARVGLGRALLVRKAAGDAIETLKPCLTDDPMAPEPHFWLARAYADKGDNEPARSQAEKATELDDHYAEAFFLLGELSRGHKDKARAAYKRYLELQPDGPQAKAAKAALKNLK